MPYHHIKQQIALAGNNETGREREREPLPKENQ